MYRILPTGSIFTSQVIDHCIANISKGNVKGSGCAVGSDP
jgi:hypothetical protein